MMVPSPQRKQLYFCDNCGKRGLIENNTCGYCYKGMFKPSRPSEGKYSPLPWKYSFMKNEYIQHGIYDADADIEEGDISVCHAWKKHDAELIVKSVNLFPRLLEALEECYEAMSDVFRENKQIGRDYLSGARQRAKDLLRSAREQQGEK